MVIYLCKADIVSIQFANRDVINYLELFDDIHAGITSVTQTKNELFHEELILRTMSLIFITVIKVFI